jgi:hypothetical protein
LTHAVAATDRINLSKRRSILTNDPRRLPGVDMRSEHGRRFRDIVEALVAEFGPVADTVRLRELAGLKFSLEHVQARAVMGDASACADLVRMSNLIIRREQELRTRIVATAPAKPSVQRRLAERTTARTTSNQVEADPIDELDPLDVINGETDDDA